MKKRVMVLLLTACLLGGCSVPSAREKTYRYTDYTLFDTVTVILGYGESEQAFQEQAMAVCDRLRTYHRLLDIYHEYDGLTNLKTINEQAALAPVPADPIVLDFLQDCMDAYRLSDGRVNVAMGAILRLWHEARTESLESPDRAFLPDRKELEAAAEHCNPEDVILDPEAGTVYFRDSRLQLDVGALAKGWSVQQVCREAPEGLLISVGGNVCATGPKPDGSAWVVGVQNPDGTEGYLDTLPLTRGSAVTSGDYQRYYTVEGRNYHHIIDPDTLEPGRLWRSVTVLCEDSGMADCLSTALFLLPREEGQRLLDRTGAEALWVGPGGEQFRSPGFPKH